MEKREFATPLGPVWLWGEAAAFEGTRPLVVAIAGAFAIAKGPLFHMAPHLAEVCDVVTGHLPGNHCPTVAAPTVAAYAGAYGHAIAEAFGHRPVVGCGASIGGLVALGLRTPVVKRLVVMEPPLRTAKLWCLLPVLRARLRDNPKDQVLRAFIEGVFGVDGERVKDRDYRPLLDGLAAPTRVIIGGDPLYPERPFKGLPSLVDEPEREVLMAHPMVGVTLVHGVGHNIPEHAARPLLDRLKQAVAAIA